MVVTDRETLDLVVMLQSLELVDLVVDARELRMIFKDTKRGFVLEMEEE
ncbi:hypothetical protein KAR91_52365 [Candidatus Pacearchaeota archaeon]|nr:hypothetical protein [Candidatus Pacearchaeota archaeon]